MKRILTAALSVAGFAVLALPAVANAAPVCRPHYAAQVNARLENQGDRIAEGRHTGELNTRQDYRLRADDSRIRLQEDKDIARNGHITTAEDVRLQHELNRTSGAIYRAKH